MQADGWLSVDRLRRRVPGLGGREAALVREALVVLASSLDIPTAVSQQASTGGDGPIMLQLTYGEVETLKAIRERPGVTVAELVASLDVSGSSIRSRVKMLTTGGDVRAELHSVPGRRGARYRRLYSANDKPIGKVRPREKAHWGARV